MEIVGLDLGTSSVKAVRFKLNAENHRIEVVASAAREHTLSVPQPGFAEQTAEQTLQMARDVLGQVMKGGDVAAIGVSGAMHSLLALREGSPLAPGWTWADLRSASQARDLKQTMPDVAGRTGTPIHPMAWPAKLLWMQEHDRDLWERADLFVGIHEYVVANLVGESAFSRGGPRAGKPMMSRSMASATGLWNLSEERWDAPILARLKLAASSLPEIVPADRVVGKLNGIPVVAGAGDGPLSNLGTGAFRPGAACLSIGTSGAIRVAHRGPRLYPEGRTFCYNVVDDLWVSGGAISNGTIAVEWLRKLLGSPPLEELLQEGWSVEPGADGLVFLPYLAGERAPLWSVDARAQLIGLTLHHGRPHLARAVVEGVCMALRDVLESLPSGLVREIRVCGGFVGSPAWVQILANVLARPLDVVESSEAGALGAALLATRALDPASSFDPWLEKLALSRRYDPEDIAQVTYDESFRVYLEHSRASASSTTKP
jgi:gluconokinase